MDTCSKSNSLSGRKSLATFPWKRSSTYSGKASLFGSFWLFCSNKHQDCCSCLNHLQLSNFPAPMYLKSYSLITSELVSFSAGSVKIDTESQSCKKRQDTFLESAGTFLQTWMSPLRNTRSVFLHFQRGKKIEKRVGEVRTISITIITYSPN